MTRKLQERLDSIRSASEKKTPPQALEIMHRATQALVDSGQAERALGEGDAAPAFELQDTLGRVVRSQDLLKRGSIVLTFFRGHW